MKKIKNFELFNEDYYNDFLTKNKDSIDMTYQKNTKSEDDERKERYKKEDENERKIFKHTLAKIKTFFSNDDTYIIKHDNKFYKVKVFITHSDFHGNIVFLFNDINTNKHLSTLKYNIHQDYLYYVEYFDYEYNGKIKTKELNGNIINTGTFYEKLYDMFSKCVPESKYAKYKSLATDNQILKYIKTFKDINAVNKSGYEKLAYEINLKMQFEITSFDYTNNRDFISVKPQCIYLSDKKLAFIFKNKDYNVKVALIYDGDSDNMTAIKVNDKNEIVEYDLKKCYSLFNDMVNLFQKYIKDSKYSKRVVWNNIR